MLSAVTLILTALQPLSYPTFYHIVKNLKLDMETEVPGIDIHYSFDETPPDQFYPKYTGTLSIPKDALSVKVITYRNGKQMGREIRLPVTELQKRAERNQRRS